MLSANILGVTILVVEMVRNVIRFIKHKRRVQPEIIELCTSDHHVVLPNKSV